MKMLLGAALFLFVCLMIFCAIQKPNPNSPLSSSEYNRNQAVANALAYANANAQTNSNVTVAAPTYNLDVIGQVVRIQAEGVGEDQIKQNIASIDPAISYKLLKKNAEPYAGKPWGFSGKILEIAEKGGNTAARIGLDTWNNDVVWVSGPITSPFVEGDQVYVVGYLAGTYEYTSQANWQISIPALALRAIMKPQDVKKYRTAKSKA